MGSSIHLHRWVGMTAKNCGIKQKPVFHAQAGGKGMPSGKKRVGFKYRLYPITGRRFSDLDFFIMRIPALLIQAGRANDSRNGNKTRLKSQTSPAAGRTDSKFNLQDFPGVILDVSYGTSSPRKGT